MRVGTRLGLAVVPAVVGVFTLAGLAYWGEYGRQAPGYILPVAAFATALSLIVAWYNTRYVAHRVERLAHEAQAVQRRVVEAGVQALKAAGLGHTAPDELDSLEALFERLAGAAVESERTARVREAAMAERARSSAALLRATAADLATQLDEVRLPIHILLDNHFGELNENQEEMLGAARAAADASGEAVRRTIAVLTATDGTLELRRDRLHGGELVEGLLGPLRTLAMARELRVLETISAPLPALPGDRALLQEALRALFTAAVGHAQTGSVVTFGAEGDAASLHIFLGYSGAAIAGMPQLFGASIVAAHGGTVQCAPNTLDVRLPSAAVVRA